ncbi:MAG: 5'-3' exonuclease H3TH domain-containing protein, partial [Candidatus Liptonbacteria bacterium]|nr:5'-3' exonuclease H3TH domain-containing protein [Candidatus Liptonbacteria bacterium]
KTIIVTGDRDTLQLVVDDRVIVYVPKKGISDSLIYDEAAVKEKFGISPKQMTDYKGIVGDQSDNIPGVKGVGEKGAARIFQKFDSLEDFFAKVDAAKLEKLPKSDQTLYKKVLADKDTALFSKYLATVRTDAPVSVSLQGLAFSGLQKEKLAPTVRRFGFDSLLARIGAPPSSQPAEGRVVLPAPAEPMRKKEEPHSANRTFDPLVSVLSPSSLGRYLISHCDDGGRLVRLDVIEGGVTRTLGEAEIFSRADEFEDAATPKIGFNLKPLIALLRSRGKDLRGGLFDIKIALWMTGADMSEKKSAALLERHGISELHAIAQKKLAEAKLEKLFYDLEMPLVPILADMERIGILIDSQSLRELAGTCGAEIVTLEKKIYKDADGPFNINSPKQLS